MNDMSMNKTTVTALAALALGCAATAAVAAGVSVKVEATPTAAETAAIKRALGPGYADEAPFTIGHADLNGDGRPDLLFRSGNSDFCSAHGCDTFALLATASGYAGKAIGLPYAHGAVFVLPAVRKGMHDLRFEGGSNTFKWDGTQYK